MATAEDLLKKAELRKKKGTFTPERKRAWDYSVQKSIDSVEIVSEKSTNICSNNIVTNSNESTNISSNNIVTNHDNVLTSSNKSSNNVLTKVVTDIGTNVVTNNSISHVPTELKSIPSTQKTSLENETQSNEKSEFHVLKLLRKTAGHQKKIMEQITAHVKATKEFTNTVDITISTLAERIQTDKNTTRTSINRLYEKLILLRTKGGMGRHGITKVIVPNYVIKECFNLFSCAPLLLEESTNKTNNISANKNSNNSAYSSSSININNTTTEENEFLKNWGEIDFDSLKEIGFSVTQLKQLQSKNTPEIVQESINHFSFGLQSNSKIKKYPEPLNVLMGVLRKGQAWVEPHYQSPQEIAQREFIERKKAERERIKKLEEETYNLAFDEWLDSLTVEKTEELAPAKPGNGLFSPQRVRLSLYFRENVWASKKAEYSK